MRVRHGVYLGAGAWPDEPGDQHLLRARAEQLVKADGAVSHRSAARYWGLPLPDEDWAEQPVWLTLPSGQRFRCERRVGLVQKVADLPENQVVDAGGYRVTSLARTAVDTANGLALPQALMVLDAALRQECSGRVVHAGRREFATPRLVAAGREPFTEAAGVGAGRASVRRALEFADPLRESPIESLSFGHIVEWGLPLPRCQAPIRTRAGTFFPDFLWEEGLIGESDGRLKYVDSGAVMREKEREQLLRDLGYRIVRWSGREIHLTPHLVMARIERALASCG